MVKSLFFIELLLVAVFVEAQTDSVSVLIREVQITSRIERLSSKNNFQNINSTLIKLNYGESLGTLLAKNANISIKQYGVSGISTLSIRGGNSYHTALVWNGFNLQDALTGGVNFTLLPVHIADEILVKYGGSSTIYGSGAIGGSILLKNNVNFNSPLQSETDFLLGSFGKINFSEQISFGTKKLSVLAKVFYQKADNDFTYTDKAQSGFPTETLQNAAMLQYGGLLNTYLKIQNNQQLSLNYWTQFNDTEVPSNMTDVNASYAQQYDRWHRLALNWKYSTEDVTVKARNGIFYTYLHYINSNYNIDAVHKSLSNVSELIVDWRVFKFTELEAAINNNYTKAKSDNFNGKPELNKSAFFLSLKTKYFKKFVFNTNIRIELIEGELKPLTFGLFGEYKFLSNYFINFNVSKNHRSPTFNDLYWSGAYAKGNPELNDEHGYTFDLSAVLKKDYENKHFNAKFTAFYNLISDMIQWVPENNIWTPLNQKKVQSLGAEFSTGFQLSITKNSILKTTANYVYTNAQIIERSVVESDDVLYKQLIYTPFHKANAFISYIYKKLDIGIHTEYTGKQYTRADNSDSIDGYFLLNVSATYKMDFSSVVCNFFVRGKNVLNAEYMQIQWYPVPPINFETGIKIIIN